MNGGTEKEGDQLMFSFIDTKYDRTHIKIINSCEVMLESGIEGMKWHQCTI